MSHFCSQAKINCHVPQRSTRVELIRRISFLSIHCVQYHTKSIDKPLTQKCNHVSSGWESTLSNRQQNMQKTTYFQLQTNQLKRCKLYLSSLMEINMLIVDYKYTVEAIQMFLTRCRKVLILHPVPIVSFLGQSTKASPRACGRNH
jgi:hypothetical protein